MKKITIYDDGSGDAPNAEELTHVLGSFCIEEDEEISFRPVSIRVTNLLYLIDELGLNQFEMSDLSAGIYNRMDWVHKEICEVCNDTKIHQDY